MDAEKLSLTECHENRDFVLIFKCLFSVLGCRVYFISTTSTVRTPVNKNTLCLVGWCAAGEIELHLPGGASNSRVGKSQEPTDAFNGEMESRRTPFIGVYFIKVSM